jgi:hypothetical protein
MFWKIYWAFYRFRRDHVPWSKPYKLRKSEWAKMEAVRHSTETWRNLVGDHRANNRTEEE